MKLKDLFKKVSDCCWKKPTPFPLVFLEPRESREAARREEPLVTLDLNLAFIQTPAVKLIITKGTSGNLAITHPLGITNQTNQSY